MRPNKSRSAGDQNPLRHRNSSRNRPHYRLLDYMFRYTRAWFESIVGKPLGTRKRWRSPRSGGLTAPGVSDAPFSWPGVDNLGNRFILGAFFRRLCYSFLALITSVVLCGPSGASPALI